LKFSAEILPALSGLIDGRETIGAEFCDSNPCSRIETAPYYHGLVRRDNHRILTPAAARRISVGGQPIDAAVQAARHVKKYSRNKVSLVRESDRPGSSAASYAICLLEYLRFDCSGILLWNRVAENGYLTQVCLIEILLTLPVLLDYSIPMIQ
jgi:hypothetical protein